MVKEKEQWYSNKELYEKFLCMFTKLEKELQATRSDVKKYNGLFNKMTCMGDTQVKIEELIRAQVKRCDEVQALKETEFAVATATDTVRDQLIKYGKDEERDRFERAIKIIGVGVLLITTATGLVTWFLNLWPK
jgi:hypothetical protein